MEHVTFNILPLVIVLLSTGVAVQLFGGFTVLTGLALRYWINRRRVNRSGGTGKIISGTGQKAILTPVEKFMKILALVFVLFGVYVIWVGFAEY